VGVGEQDRVHPLELGRLVGEVVRHVDQYTGAEIEKSRALPAPRLATAGRAATGAGAEQANPQSISSSARI
jgi:hypothetical protein